MSQPLYIAFPTFTYAHTNCDGGNLNGLTVSITDYSWASIHENTIKVLEEDPDNEGTYPLTWTVCPAEDSVISCQSVDYTIILAACLLDQVTPTAPINDFDYVMGGGPISIGPNLQQRFDNCEINYTLMQQGWTVIDPQYNTNLFSFDEETGVLTIDYVDG